MDVPSGSAVPADNSLVTNGLEYGGFPAFLWEMLRSLGYTEQPSYRVWGDTRNGMRTYHAEVVVPIHPFRSTWMEFTTFATSHSIQSAVVKAAYSGIVRFRTQHGKVLSGTPYALIPGFGPPSPGWQRRFQAVSDAAEPTYSEELRLLASFTRDLHEVEQDSTTFQGQQARALTTQGYDISSLETELVATREGLDSVTVEASRLTSDLSAKDDEVDVLTGQLHDRDQQIAALTAQLAAQQQLVHERNTTIVQQENHRFHIQGLLNIANGTIHDLEGTVADQQNDIDDLQQQLDQALAPPGNGVLDDSDSDSDADGDADGGDVEDPIPDFVL